MIKNKELPRIKKMDSKGRRLPILLPMADSKMEKPRTKPLVGNRMDKNKIVGISNNNNRRRVRQMRKKMMGHQSPKTPIIIIKTLQKILKKMKQLTRRRMILKIKKTPNPKMDKKLRIKIPINSQMMSKLRTQIPKMINRIPRKPQPIMVPTSNKKPKIKQTKSKMVEKHPKILLPPTTLTNKLQMRDKKKKRRCHLRIRMMVNKMMRKELLRMTQKKKIKSLKKRKKTPSKTKTLKKANMFLEVTLKVERYKLIGGGEIRKKSHGGGISGKSGMRLSLLSQF